METLPLHELHQRHYGLTQGLATSYTEAARVCLDRHHTPPQQFELQDDECVSAVVLIWEQTTSRELAAYNNNIDAIEIGAYACAIAAVELSRGLYAVRRTETLKGADYYVAPADSDVDDLESCYRLEVSGTDNVRAVVKTRLKQKVQQTIDGKSNLPALAAVVGFSCKLILIQTVDIQ